MNEDMMQQAMGMLNSDGGLKGILMDTQFEDEETGHTFSQADLLADVINILRMDTKRIAEAVGMEMEVDKMSPGRAAEILEGMAKGTDRGLVDIFDDIEDKRMRILEELEDEEAVDEFMELKSVVLYSHPTEPEDIDVGGSDDGDGEQSGAETDTEGDTDEN